MITNLHKVSENYSRSHTLFRRLVMCRKGISLIEIIVVVSIIGILALALGFSYQGWIGRYNVEKQIKEIYTDLMTARATAMNKDREYFVDFNNTGSLVNPVTNVTAPCYRIIGDTAAVNDWATDGDGEWDADGDSKIDPVHTVLPGYPKAVEYIINWTGGTLIFDKKGLIKPSSTPLGATLSLTTTADADYDCIKISQTRINMGKMEECDASNPGTECCAK